MPLCIRGGWKTYEKQSMIICGVIKIKAYYHSEAYQDFFSQDANALAILIDTTHLTGNRTAALLSTMAQQLYISKGALAFSNASIASGFA